MVQLIGDRLESTIGTIDLHYMESDSMLRSIERDSQVKIISWLFGSQYTNYSKAALVQKPTVALKQEKEAGGVMQLVAAQLPLAIQIVAFG